MGELNSTCYEKQRIIHRILEEKYKSSNGFYRNSDDLFHFYDETRELRVFLNGIDISSEIDLIMRRRIADNDKKYEQLRKKQAEIGNFFHVHMPIEWSILENSVEEYKNMKLNLQS